MAPRRERIAFVFFALLLGASSARTYRNPAMKVRAFEPPAGWELAPQASYPRLLASYAHPGGGRLTLSAQKVPPETTAQALVQQARTSLAKQGFSAITVRADATRQRLDADLDGGKRFVRQLYVVEQGLGYVVTLVAPAASNAPMTADFEAAVASLKLGAE